MSYFVPIRRFYCWGNCGNELNTRQVTMRVPGISCPAMTFEKSIGSVCSEYGGDRGFREIRISFGRKCGVDVLFYGPGI